MSLYRIIPYSLLGIRLNALLSSLSMSFFLSLSDMVSCLSMVLRQCHRSVEVMS